MMSSDDVDIEIVAEMRGTVNVVGNFGVPTVHTDPAETEAFWKKARQEVMTVVHKSWFNIVQARRNPERINAAKLKMYEDIESTKTKLRPTIDVNEGYDDRWKNLVRQASDRLFDLLQPNRGEE